MKDEIIKPDAVAQNAMAAVKACKGTPVDKLIILVLTLFHNIGLNIADFSMATSDLNDRLDELTKLMSKPYTEAKSKKLSAMVSCPRNGYYHFIEMTEAEQCKFNSLPTAERIELFAQVVQYIHCYMTVGASTFLFELMYYSVDTDPLIVTKAKALFFVLNGDDFCNYNDEIKEDFHE